MVGVLLKPQTFDDFVDFDDRDEVNEYEWVNGRLLLMPEPTDEHEEIIEFLSFMFELQYRRLKLAYSVRKRNALMIPGFTGRRPDVAVIHKPSDRTEAKKRGIRTVPLMLVEVASTNWSTDLVEKQEEYQALKVPEYWIVDYEGQIPAKYCDRGKGQKVIVFTLIEGEYQKEEYLPGEIVPCLTFKDLNLTVNQIINATED
jgi:Uma2 family endonuclease